MNKSMEVEQLPFVPNEILIEILSKLPVKTLLVFRGVCKRWYYMISHPQFVTMHLNQKSKQSEKILLSSDRNKLVNPLCSIDLESSSDQHQIDKIVIPSENPSYMGYICGSCNGLVLVGNRYNNIFLWNPFMREFREIPYPLNNSVFNVVMYGLGYNSSTDDYHIVVIHFVDELFCSFVFYTFTLETNSWIEKIDICSYEYCYRQTKTAGTFVNGFLHWVMIDSLDGDSHKIVFFDLEKKTLKDMSLPNSLDLANEVSLHLGVLGDKLSVVSMVDSGVRRAIKVWVMKEYGIQESWTNLMNFTYNECLDYISPFCYTRKGVIIVELKGKNMLMAVDCDKKVFNAILVADNMHLMPFTHLEYLVSVYGRHGNPKRCIKSKFLHIALPTLNPDVSPSSLNPAALSLNQDCSDIFPSLS